MAAENHRRPAIMCLDAPVTAERLRANGYSVTEGTYGQPFLVSPDGDWLSLTTQTRAPGLTEADVMIVGLKGPEAIAVEPAVDAPGPDVKATWVPCRTGLVDPRPIGMIHAQEYVDRNLGHGGILIAIVAPPRDQTFVVCTRAEVQYGHLRSEIQVSNWHVSRELSGMHVRADAGEARPTEVALKLGLEAGLWAGGFNCVLEPPGMEQAVRLATNRFDDCVAALIPAGDVRPDTLVLLPPVQGVHEIVARLLEGPLARLHPEVFELGGRSSWLHDEAYEHPEVLELQSEVDGVRARAQAAETRIIERIEAARARDGFLHDLLTADDDVLVSAVIAALVELGVTEVIDVDAVAQGKSTLREDLHLKHPGRPVVLGEVKGSSGKPKEEDALQVIKNVAPRMREWETVDLRALTVVNHQRNLPPFERAREPFQPDVITTAMANHLTLISTWELFCLVRESRRHGWPSGTCVELLYVDGRPDVVPGHYELAGTIEHRWPEPNALQMTPALEIAVDDRLAFEGPEHRFVEARVLSIQAEGVEVPNAVPGRPVGISTEAVVSDLRDGARVFRVR